MQKNNLTVIALQGKGSIGKTQTLKQVLFMLSKGAIKETKATVIDYKNKRIGITTYGDNKEELENLFEFYTDCDIYVCACRTKGETVKYLSELTSKGKLIYHGKWFTKKVENEKNVDGDFINDSNQIQAEYIIKEIDNQIK